MDELLPVFLMLGYVGTGLGIAVVDTIAAHINEMNGSAWAWMADFVMATFLWPIALPDIIERVKEASARVDGSGNG